MRTRWKNESRLKRIVVMLFIGLAGTGLVPIFGLIQFGLPGLWLGLLGVVSAVVMAESAAHLLLAVLLDADVIDNNAIDNLLDCD